MYAKLINGVLEYAPEKYIVIHTIDVEKEDENGDTVVETITEEIEIINFNKSIELMIKYGFKEVIDIKPEHTEMQTANVKGYEELETSIRIVYEVVDRELNADEKIDACLQIQVDMGNRLSVTQDAVDFLLMNSISSTKQTKNMKFGGNTMGAYLAMRIMDGALKYEDVIAKYPQFKSDIDMILKCEGFGHLITK